MCDTWGQGQTLLLDRGAAPSNLVRRYPAIWRRGLTRSDAAYGPRPFRPWRGAVPGRGPNGRVLAVSARDGMYVSNV